MVNEAVQTYVDTARELKAAIEELRRLSRPVAACQQGLMQWTSTVMTGTDVRYPGVMLPGGMGMQLEAATWPSAEQLAQALLRGHDAVRAAQTAWQALRDEDHDVLLSPEALLAANRV